MDIDRVAAWCELNGMQVNIEKSSTVTFARSRTSIAFEYKLKEARLKRVTTIIDLGVLIDHKLTFSEHIIATTAKAFAVLGFVKRNTRFFRDIYCLKTLYCSLVRSVLEYAILVWAPYHVTQVNRLERVQRKFLRYALRMLPWRNPIALPPYEQRCKLINLESLSKRRLLLQRLFIFDVLNGNIDCPELLGKLRISTPLRTTRRHDFLQITHHRTLYGYNNPLDVCCRNFNTVYNHFDFNMSKNVFRLRFSQ